MRRLLLAGVVLAFPISALGVGLSGPASASVVNPPSGVTCTKIKANIVTGTTAKLKGCSDLPNTGGHGKTTIAALASGAGTITWNGTGTTTLANGTFTQITPSACPPDSTGQPGTEYEVTLTVTGGTGKAKKSILVGWTLQAFVCIDNGTGNVTLLPGTVINIGAGF